MEIKNEDGLYKFLSIREIEKLGKSSENKTIAEVYKEASEIDKKNQPWHDLYCLNYLVGDGNLWLSKYHSTNDPFEFNGYYHRDFLIEDILSKLYKEFRRNGSDNITINDWNNTFIENNPDKLISWEEINNRENNTPYSGLFCFSLSCQSVAMWSHYANHHKGICIKFKMPDYFKKIIHEERKITIIKYVDKANSDGPILLLGKVDYCDSPLIVDEKSFIEYEKCLKSVYASLSKNNVFNYGEKLNTFSIILAKFMLTKKMEWKYENEFRLVTFGLSCDNDEDILPIKNFIIPETSEELFQIESIILGCKVPTITKELVKNSYGKKYPLQQAKTKRGTYLLEFEEIL